MQNLPSNWKNDGRRFENLFKQVAADYMRRRIMRLEKVEPPTRIVGARPNARIIYLENPFADWIGAWTERAARMLLIETKSTVGEKLEIGADNKLSEKQINWLMRWHIAGAVGGVVWESNYRVGFLPLGLIKDVVDSGRRHIKFSEADPVPAGIGFCLFDFVVNLRRWYPAGDEPAGQDAGRLATRSS